MNTKYVKKENLVIQYHLQGEGYPIVLLASKGRSAKDFEQVAETLSKQGFHVIMPEYRGVEGSKGSMKNLNLIDLAEDVALVLDNEQIKSAFIVGHAFGNWIARILAKIRPDLVKAVCVLAAAAKGEFKPEISEALKNSSDYSIENEERLKYIEKAFFKTGHDASSWLEGWYTEAITVHTNATGKPPQDEWWDAGGKVKFFEIRAEHDPFAPLERAGEMKEQFGDRVTSITIPNASHSLLPEQPEAVASALLTYGKLLYDKY